jgi:anion-transporting  ArsA/GET3 family ATPase
VTSPIFEALTGADVVVCIGSGGVGKTTTAAVLAMEQARAGRRVVVLTIDPARRLADALGLPDGIGPEPTRIDLDLPDAVDDLDGVDHGELWAMMLDPVAMFEHVVRSNAGSPEQAATILTNRFYVNVANSLSGTHEYMAAEALHLLHADDRFDLVVVDTPPSRNAIDFLQAPGVLARFLDHAAFRLLMLPARSGLKILNTAAQPVLRAIGRVVGTDVLADAVTFFQAFAGMEQGFRDRAKVVTALLTSPATRYVLVASPRHDTVTEAVWFAEHLEADGVPVAGVVVNRAHPRFGEGTAADAAARAGTASDPDVAALWSNLAELRTIVEREQAELAPLLEVAHGVPVAEVPLLDDDVHDLVTLSTIGDHLAGRSAGAAGRR